MPPIPIYSSSPIAPTKASDVTPQTSGTEEQGKSVGQNVTAATTTTTAAAPPASSEYAVPQPGAPAMPAPTGTAPNTSRYAPIKPTPTQPLPAQPEYRGPPPPQPGPVPVPRSATATHTLPPPPKAGEKYNPATVSAPASYPTHPLAPPPQAGLPPPTVPYSQRGTSTTSTAFSRGSTAFTARLPLQPQQPPPTTTAATAATTGTGAHPPGYQQDPNASELNRDQRAAVIFSAAERGTSGSFVGSLGGSSDSGASGAMEGVWDSASKFVQAAGKKLSEAEGEVWRRIGKE